MSDINIKSEKDLKIFLKLVSQEAYKKSLRENKDPFVEKYNSDYMKDEKRYGALDEVEGEEEQVEEEEPAAEESPVDAEETVESEGVRAVSFDSIKKAIKILRSGKSVDSDQVEDSLNIYYDRLDDNERLVLYTFLDELSKIMNLSIEGDSAQDPGDPPLNIDFVTGDEAADQEAEAGAEEVETDLEGGEEDVAADEEDTAPPIEVNEGQNKRALLAKIRHLMAK